MPSTSFSTGTTITAAWLNDVNAVVYSIFNALAVVPTVGKILRSNGTNVVGSTFTMPDTYTANSLIYASALNTIAALAVVNSAMLVTDGSGVPSLVAFTGSGAPVRGTSPTIASPTISGTVAGGATYTAPTISDPVLTGTTTAQGLVDLSGASAGQIKFPAAQNASANANTLDDYEEGTWTPSLGGNTTYSIQIGRYTKIGRMVHFSLSLTVTAIGTGSVRSISGLPYTSAIVTNHSWSISVGYIDTLASSVVWVLGLVQAGANSIDLVGLTAAATTVSSPVIFGNGSRIQISGCYETA